MNIITFERTYLIISRAKRLSLLK